MTRFRGNLIAGIISCCLLFPGTIADANGCEPNDNLDQSEVNFAVSLTSLNDELRLCGGNLTCGAAARSLYGMTRVDGVLVDSGDLLIIGRKKAEDPPLDIDDFVVNLRSAMMIYARQAGYHTPVGVTIDMRPDTFRRLQKVSSKIKGLTDYDKNWPRACSLPMDAKTFSIPHGSSASAKMMSIDYWLKFVSNGQARILGLESVTERNLNALLAQARAGTEVGDIGGMTRYWFAAGDDDVVEDEGLYFIRKLNVALLDEAEFLSGNGDFKPTGGINTAAREFTCEMTAMMGRLADDAEHAQFKELADVFRWNAIATLIFEEGLFDRSGFRPDWLINDHRISLYDVPTTFEGVSRVYHWPNAEEQDTERLNIRFVLPSCGGVQIDYQNLSARVRRNAQSMVLPIRFAVLSQRPNDNAQAWPVIVAGQD